MLDGQSVYARPVGLCLGRSPGLSLHVLSLDQCPSLRFSRYTRSFGVYAPGTLMDAIKDFCAKTHVDVIFPVDEVATEFVATHRAALSRLAAPHPTPPASLLRLGLDKWALAEYLLEGGIPHPNTVLASRLAESPREFRSDHPVLLKPRVGGGGRGIRWFATPTAALDFLSKNGKDFTQYIVQECIPGHDIDCSVLCVEGEILAHTVQKAAARNDSFRPAGVIELVHDDVVLRLIRKLVQATHWGGVAHVDCRYDERDGSIKAIEINPRYWGSIYGSLRAGVNFPWLACQAALGVAFPQPAYADICFASGAATIKERRSIRVGRSHSRATYSAWRYFGSDPLPELVDVCTKILAGLWGRSLA